MPPPNPGLVEPIILSVRRVRYEASFLQTVSINAIVLRYLKKFDYFAFAINSPTEETDSVEDSLSRLRFI